MHLAPILLLTSTRLSATIAATSGSGSAALLETGRAVKQTRHAPAAHAPAAASPITWERSMALRSPALPDSVDRSSLRCMHCYGQARVRGTIIAIIAARQEQKGSDEASTDLMAK